MTFNVRFEVKNNTFPIPMKNSIVGIVCQTVLAKENQDNKIKTSSVLYNKFKEVYPDYNFQVFCIERDSSYSYLGDLKLNCTIQIDYHTYIIFANKEEEKVTTSKKKTVSIRVHNNFEIDDDLNSYNKLNLNK